MCFKKVINKSKNEVFIIPTKEVLSEKKVTELLVKPPLANKTQKNTAENCFTIARAP